MNKIFALTKGDITELYFASEKKSKETLDKDLREFEEDGWKLYCLLSADEETFYRIRFKNAYDKHMLYRDLYQKGAEFETSDGDWICAQTLVHNTGVMLVKLARKIMQNGFDIEIPELVHHYIMNYDREDPDRFRDFILS